MEVQVQHLISKVEDATENIIRKTRKVFPIIGRLLLISTFVEDGLRLFFNPSEHANHYSHNWNLNYYVSYFLTLYSMIVLLGCSLLVMLRIKVPVACGLLASVICMQVMLYQLYTSFQMIARNVSIIAAVLLLFTENLMRQPKKYDQMLRHIDDVELSSMLLMISRLFLNLMLVSMVPFTLEWRLMITSTISYILMFLLWFGFKARMVSVLLAFWLTIYNYHANCFWLINDTNNVVRYDFFQTLSATGGLLLLMHTGPGELSVDELKKKW